MPSQRKAGPGSLMAAQLCTIATFSQCSFDPAACPPRSYAYLGPEGKDGMLWITGSNTVPKRSRYWR